MGLLDSIYNNRGAILGNGIDLLGTGLRATTGWSPNLGLSEKVAGGNTAFTGSVNERGFQTVNKIQPPEPDVEPDVEVQGVSDPNSAQTNNNVNYYNGGGTTTTGASQPAYNPQTVAQFDQSISLIEDALGRLGTQLNIAKGNVGKQYNTSINELNSAKSRNKNNFDQSSTTNQQNLRTNRNAILDQQSAGLRGLLRQLGAYGAVGSDMNVASGAVQDVAQRDMSGAGLNYAQNQQGLDTSWNNYLSEWANSKKKADQWKQQQLQGIEQQSLSSKQDLLAQLADTRGRRAATIGGDYAGAAAGDLARARGLSGRIDALGKLNPVYDGKTPTYDAPELSSYLTPQAQQVDASNLANNATANPSLALLLGLDERQRQL